MPNPVEVTTAAVEKIKSPAVIIQATDTNIDPAPTGVKNEKIEPKKSGPGANPTKLFFFVNKEFFRFSLLSLAIVQYTHFFHV